MSFLKNATPITISAKHGKKPKIPMARRNVIASAIVILFGGLGNLAFGAESKTLATDNTRIELVYSEDDALCKPLRELYQWLTHDRPSPDLYDWEDKYASHFRAIGLRQPKPLDDPLHPLHVSVPLKAYYRLRFSGEQQERLVYVQDIWFGTHGAFQTNVWILKRSADVVSGGSNGAIPDERFTADDVAVAVLLGSNGDIPGEYRKIQSLYFKKSSTPAELDLPEQQKPLHIPTIGAGGNYIIQRVFEFHDAIVFLAEDGLRFMAYRFKDDQIDDVCYLAMSGSLSSVGWESRRGGK